ncbi:MAG: CDP-glucose 4,6-dehydratase [Desulfobacterales bacterium]|jgi:CDP-glucose 4,6-dehydratase|nr:CDP-glucose 4,6-dehydratase [Desulfobacterales bacterium]
MESELRDFYRDKKVLVTGHTGFKGSWLSLWLRELGADVIGYALPPPTTPSHHEACRLKDRITSIEGDVRDLGALKQVLTDYRPEIVFHLAAQSLVRRSYQEPVATFGTNVMGTVHLLEACRQCSSVAVVVNVTSDKCYENKEWVWGYRENDRLGGDDPYSSSKGCAELVAAAYARSYFDAGRPHACPKALASVRAGNVIGGGDWAEDRLIPDCMRTLSRQRPVVIRNPLCVRPWQHVLEPLYGYLLLAVRMHAMPDRFSGAWNFGPNEAAVVTVQGLVNHVLEEWGGGAFETPAGRDPHEARTLKLDSSKANTLLGWRQRWTFRQAVSATIDWYRRFFAGEEMYGVSQEQIAAYMSA